ncbi:Mini-ribonuclease 3 [Ferroacidibacillus organovorans]|uniref:Mini-ribonuclease 3 n=1 Tax=Ferroacidibacillus organovorans TaxID=1765683 RepID=A0A101XPB0_9BACL|nr:ribonuclease III domain-containing protein [Ferroacidibacillus organovorans]KUO95115.1 hypothetical protein ATW55_13725 [Ferroacidibacillus organovorans]
MMSEQEAFAVAPLALAYLGDAVWELAVRESLIAKGERQPNQLHQQALGYVKAVNQADRIRRMSERLTEREMSIFKRGRNAKSHSMPKSARMADYRHSTGLEALLGYLYLTGDQARMEELLRMLLAEPE